MANRRAIGRGLMMASQVLGDYFQRQSQETQLRERQRIDDERATAAARAKSENDALLARTTKFLEQNPSALAETLGRARPNRDVASPISEQVTKADSISKMPTDDDVRTQYDTGGGRTTLDSRNITRGVNGLVSTDNEGGQSVLDRLMRQTKSKRDVLAEEANAPNQFIEEKLPDGSSRKVPVNPRNADSIVTGLTAKREGELAGEKAQAAAPGEGAAELTKFNATSEAKFKHEQRLATMRAAVELEAWKKKNAVTASNAAKEAAQGATAGLLQMEEIIALATEVNKGNTVGTADVYAGAKNAIGQLPYVGTSIASLMDTANATTSSILDRDPTLPAKVNQLQASRRAAAISVIRAAGDTRPSNADVDGVINMIPGAGESLFATAQKASTMRDTFTLIPEIVQNHPELVGEGKGYSLIQFAMAEARKRAEGRAQKGSPKQGVAPAPPGPAQNAPPSPPAAPGAPVPAPQGETPAQRLQRLRNARRGSGG